MNDEKKNGRASGDEKKKKKTNEKKRKKMDGVFVGDPCELVGGIRGGCGGVAAKARAQNRSLFFLFLFTRKW